VSKAVKRAHVGRPRTIGVLAVVAIIGAAMFITASGVQAAAGDGGATTTGLSAGPMKGAVVPHDKLPAGAVRATHARPKPGAQGVAFQARDAVSPRVVGGSLANAADYPWIVGIHTYFFVLEGDQFVEFVQTCTGTVVTPTKVLTAGHCAAGQFAGTTDVIAGRNNLDSGSGGYVARVSSTWIHQGFNLAALYSGAADVPIDDVAVLTLQQPLPSVYTPVALTPQGNQTPYADGTIAKTLGYGITTPGGQDAGVLHVADVTIRSDATCGSALSGYDSSRMTCAGTPGSGVDSCSGDSGGPLMVNGVEAAITDWGQGACGSLYGVYERLSTYANAIAEDYTRPPLVNLDWSGDGHSDLLARDEVTGDLIEFSGGGFADDGFGGFTGAAIIGGGWQGYTKLFRVSNWNGDGRPSLMARNSSGQLFQYKNDGRGNWDGGAVQVGTGWNMFNDIMVVNNWTGDGHPNLLGRTPTGDLYLYTSDGQGGWLNNGVGIKVGTGWNMFNTILTPGPWNGDGHQALIGRTPSGDLFLYHSDGSGGWMNNGVGIKIGTGWNMFTIFMSPGDWNGDNLIDLIGLTPSGDVRMYKTDGQGNWLNPSGQLLQSGFNGLYIF